MGRATRAPQRCERKGRHFNPRPPWGGRQKGAYKPYKAHLISIHALRGEGDAIEKKAIFLTRYFNPRPPWGGRQQNKRIPHKKIQFQSTPSVGRATILLLLRLVGFLNFNPRPPWGGRRESDLGYPLSRFISIHALRGEGDADGQLTVSYSLRFQSTPSVGRATFTALTAGQGKFTFQSTPSVGRATRAFLREESIKHISIHALRGEGDAFKFITVRGRNVYFNPRPPWGGRQKIRIKIKPSNDFNPRPPWGGRRLQIILEWSTKNISIHALRGEGDNFYRPYVTQGLISIHALRGEGDEEC